MFKWSSHAVVMHFAAWTPPVAGPTVVDHSRQKYEVADGATPFTNDPGLKATLEVLNARWPWTLSRRELVTAVHERLVSAGLQPSTDLAGHVDNLMGVLIVQGQVRYRLDGTRDRDGLLEALLTIDREDPFGMEHDVLVEHVDGLAERLAEMKLLRVDSR